MIERPYIALLKRVRNDKVGSTPTGCFKIGRLASCINNRIPFQGAVMRNARPVKTTEMCKFGCGNVAGFENAQGGLMCEEYSTKCPINKEKNSANARRSANRASGKEIYARMPQEKKDRMADSNRGKITIIPFGIGPSRNQHKKLLIIERGYKCEQCNLSQWNDLPIPLEKDHVNGDRGDNRKENLKLLCPNCHAQTVTYRGKNIKKRTTVSNEEFIEALTSTKNVRQALLKLNLTPSAGNYVRAYEMLGELGIIKQKTEPIYVDRIVKVRVKDPDSHARKERLPVIRKAETKPRKAFARKTKIEWPNHETLQMQVLENGYELAGRTLGVTGAAVKKFLKKNGIVIPRFNFQHRMMEHLTNEVR